MTETISLIQLAGGLGIFLVGMITMTDAMKALAGRQLRNVLMGFTRSPASGALTGAVSTAILQSSSATTVAAVGFVGAGLMTFPSALGIVFGANLGTTITGWIVALIGFKLQLTSLMYLLVLLGALLRLFTRGRTGTIGLVVAGFGIIFVGIEQMQQGMQGAEDLLSWLDLPTDTYAGRLQLLLIGAVFTVLTQSSSAGVAAVLTALFTDSISLAQGLSLVIGMDIGTTVTAVIATIGSSTQARRTGYSHFTYNILTGAGAFLLLIPYVQFWEARYPDQITANAEFILVGFHSAFNLLGVLLVLPFTSQFAHLMMRLVPDSSDRYTAALDPSLLSEPPMALEGLGAAISNELPDLLREVRRLLQRSDDYINMHRLQEALDETHRFADEITPDADSDERNRLLAYLHILDHMQRMHERCEEDGYRAVAATRIPELAELCNQLNDTVTNALEQIPAGEFGSLQETARITLIEADGTVEPFRASVMQQVADGVMNIDEANEQLEAIRWLRRVSYHISQVAGHLAG